MFSSDDVLEKKKKENVSLSRHLGFILIIISHLPLDEFPTHTFIFPICSSIIHSERKKPLNLNIEENGSLL